MFATITKTKRIFVTITKTKRRGSKIICLRVPASTTNDTGRWLGMVFIGVICCLKLFKGDILPRNDFDLKYSWMWYRNIGPYLRPESNYITQKLASKVCTSYGRPACMQTRQYKHKEIGAGNQQISSLHLAKGCWVLLYADSMESWWFQMINWSQFINTMIKTPVMFISIFISYPKYNSEHIKVKLAGFFCQLAVFCLCFCKNDKKEPSIRNGTDFVPRNTVASVTKSTT